MAVRKIRPSGAVPRADSGLARARGGGVRTILLLFDLQLGRCLQRHHPELARSAGLRAENARLLKLLRLSPQQACPVGPGQAAFFEAPPGVVHHRSPQEAEVAFFGALFAARTDVYANPV